MPPLAGRLRYDGYDSYNRYDWYDAYNGYAGCAHFPQHLPAPDAVGRTRYTDASSGQTTRKRGTQSHVPHPATSGQVDRLHLSEPVAVCPVLHPQWKQCADLLLHLPAASAGTH